MLLSKPIPCLQPTRISVQKSLPVPSDRTPCQNMVYFSKSAPHPRMSLQRTKAAACFPLHPPSMVSTWYVHCRGQSSAGHGLGEKGEDVSRRSRLPTPSPGPPHSTLWTVTHLAHPLPLIHSPVWPCLRAARGPATGLCESPCPPQAPVPP